MWLGRTGLADWRVDFEAAPGELSDLLKFVRLPGTNLGQVLRGGAEVSVHSTVFGEAEVSGLRIGYQLGVDDPAPLVAVDAQAVVKAELHPSLHTDLAMLIDAGFSLAGRVVADDDGYLALGLRVDVE